MNISDIKGMKYPDEYFIKYFFKQGFHCEEKKFFLEFGSSNGNNLSLPYQYGHDVVGVDFDETLIAYAEENFKKLQEDNTFEFAVDDMRSFAKKRKNLQADVLLLPNIINYISRDEFVSFLHTMVKHKNIKKGAEIFIRCRTPKDFRFGIGEYIDNNSYKMPDDYHDTGEAGCLNRFYTPVELVDILKRELQLKEFKLFESNCQNEHSGKIVLNSDIILWGKIL